MESIHTSIIELPKDPLALAQLRVGAFLGVMQDPNRRPGVGPHIVDEARRKVLGGLSLDAVSE